jgi:DNA-binding NarL/FixJ family response regulator
MAKNERELTINVGLVEQNPLAAAHLHTILEKDAAVRIAKLEALNTRETPGSPVVFLLDNCGLPMPLSEYLRRLRQRFPEAKFIVIDGEQPKDNVLRLLWFGIDGFLPYAEVGGSLLHAVRSVAQGNIWVSREILRDYVQCSKDVSKRTTRSPEAMTLRENQILELVKRRLANKEIADILHIRESTVKFHLSNIFSKLHVSTRYELLDPQTRHAGWEKLSISPQTAG